MSITRIENAYKLKNSEKQIIATHFSGDYNDWKKETFKGIKKSIVEYLRDEQENKCCYCKRELGYDIKDVDIEHILPKSQFGQFTFNTKNLALSCPGCNTKKGNKVITSYNYQRYPRNGKNIKIVHAHYDEYYNHIEIKDGLIFVPISRKGSETITACELFRLRHLQKRAIEQKTKGGIRKLVEMLRTASKTEEEELKQALLDIIKG